MKKNIILPIVSAILVGVLAVGIAAVIKSVQYTIIDFDWRARSTWKDQISFWDTDGEHIRTEEFIEVISNKEEMYQKVIVAEVYDIRFGETLFEDDVLVAVQQMGTNTFYNPCYIIKKGEELTIVFAQFYEEAGISKQVRQGFLVRINKSLMEGINKISVAMVPTDSAYIWY